MNNEFKKVKNTSETRYILETATAGATSAGAVASVTGSIGKVQKRGNILAQESDKKKEAPKPRNFVAKNAKMGGAGQHKDKKKAQKQGTAKHKKPYAESINALKNKLDTLKEAFGRRDAYQRDQDNAEYGMSKHQSRAYRADGGGNDERHDLDPTDWYVVKDGKMFAVSVYPNQEQEARARGYSRTRDEAKEKASDVGEGLGDWFRKGLDKLNWDSGEANKASDDFETRMKAEWAKYADAARQGDPEAQKKLKDLKAQINFHRTGSRDGMSEGDAYMESLAESLTHVLQEKAPPGDKYERMVKHIKKGYSKDGKLSDVEKSKAYGAAWKAKNKSKK